MWAWGVGPVALSIDVGGRQSPLCIIVDGLFQYQKGVDNILPVSAEGGLLVYVI